MLSDIANVLKSEKHIVPLITMGNSMSLSGSKDVTTSLLVLTLTLYAGNSGNSCSLHTEPCEVCCSGKKKKKKNIMMVILPSFGSVSLGMRGLFDRGSRSCVCNRSTYGGGVLWRLRAAHPLSLRLCFLKAASARRVEVTAAGYAFCGTFQANTALYAGTSRAHQRGGSSPSAVPAHRGGGGWPTSPSRAPRRAGAARGVRRGDAAGARSHGP